MDVQLFVDSHHRPSAFLVGCTQELEDALRGEAWNFVQLPLSTVLNETKDIDKVSMSLRGPEKHNCGGTGCQKHNISLSDACPNLLCFSWFPKRRWKGLVQLLYKLSASNNLTICKY